MKFSRWLLLPVLASCLCGCQTQQAGLKYEDGKLTVYDYRLTLARNLELEQDAGSRTPEGFLTVQVRVRNRNNENFHCMYRFVWKDSLGKDLTNADYVTDKALVLRGCEEQVLESTAPLATATDYRLELRPQYK